MGQPLLPPRFGCKMDDGIAIGSDDLAPKLLVRKAPQQCSRTRVKEIALSVNAKDFTPFIQKFGGQMTTDEAAASCNCNLHTVSILAAHG